MAADPIGRLRYLLARLEDLLLILLLTAMLGIATWQILLRNLFDGGLVHGEALLRVLVLWITVVGAMVAARRGRHIRIDILPRLLPPLWRAAAWRLVDLLAAVVCGAVVWYGARFVALDLESGIEVIPGLPAWWAELAIPFGFTVMTLRFLLDALTGKVSEPTP